MTVRSRDEIRIQRENAQQDKLEAVVYYFVPRNFSRCINLKDDQDIRRSRAGGTPGTRDRRGCLKNLGKYLPVLINKQN